MPALTCHGAVTQQKTYTVSAFVVPGASKAAIALMKVFEVQDMTCIMWQGEQPY
jgi:hypothetical protein